MTKLLGIIDRCAIGRKSGQAGVLHAAIGMVMAVGWTNVMAQTPPVLANLSLEELSAIKVTIATKQPEALSEIPAAVTVMTGDEIHQLGVTSIPDALRYVPGMDVARINSSQWGVSARGFNGPFANLLLVMMDGRSVYNPLAGGVYWVNQHTLLDDLDRIEVVRGPGGALWGANAVNGVVNILSKDARDTHGTLASVSGGDFNQLSIQAREGFAVSAHTDARVFALYDRYNDLPFAAGGSSEDDWHRVQTGFRIDSRPDAATHWTLQGDAHRATDNAMFRFPNFTPPAYSAAENFTSYETGVNVLSRWTRQLDAGSTLTAQAYYDYFRQLGETQSQLARTIDFDVMHAFSWHTVHLINWGVDYRLIDDTVEPTRVFKIPGHEQSIEHLLSLFAQDRIALRKDSIFLTLGAKLEDSSYASWYLEPNVRLSWLPTHHQTLWTAVSRAVATPNHASTGMQLTTNVLPPDALGSGSPATLREISGASYQTEKVVTWEAGYRIQPIDTVSIDLATFFNRYSDLRIFKRGSPNFSANPATLPVYWVNAGSGSTQGAELALAWQPFKEWRLQANYSWFNSGIAPGDVSVGRGDGASAPRNKFSLHSSVALPQQWQWDVGLRYVDNLESLNIPSYWEVDTRLAWQLSAQWELSIVGQNLLHAQHAEIRSGVNPIPSEMVRSVYGKITWRY